MGCCASRRSRGGRRADDDDDDDDDEYDEYDEYGEDVDDLESAESDAQPPPPHGASRASPSRRGSATRGVSPQSQPQSHRRHRHHHQHPNATRRLHHHQQQPPLHSATTPPLAPQRTPSDTARSSPSGFDAPGAQRRPSLQPTKGHSSGECSSAALGASPLPDRRCSRGPSDRCQAKDPARISSSSGAGAAVTNSDRLGTAGSSDGDSELARSVGGVDEVAEPVEQRACDSMEAFAGDEGMRRNSCAQSTVESHLAVMASSIASSRARTTTDDATSAPEGSPVANDVARQSSSGAAMEALGSSAASTRPGSASQRHRPSNLSNLMLSRHSSARAREQQHHAQRRYDGGASHAAEAGNPLVAPPGSGVGSDSQRSASTTSTGRAGSGRIGSLLLGNAVALPDGMVPDAISIDLLAKCATPEQWALWRACFCQIGAPVMAKLTHAGRRGVDDWLSEVGANPDIVPSLASAGPGGGVPLSRRTLQSNDRIIRTLNERRRPSSAATSDDDEDNNNRRRSSTRHRIRLMRQDNDPGLVGDFAELVHDAADSSEGEDSSRDTVRTSDNMRSTSLNPMTFGSPLSSNVGARDFRGPVSCA